MAFYYDSRQIEPGDTFICLPGGEHYISEARARGASEIRTMTRPQFAAFAAQNFGDPSKHLVVIGVTGTNGKTTVTTLVAQALTKMGFKTEILGTLNAKLTTPEAWDIQSAMADHLALGGSHFVMEVSSHGIDQHRVEGIHFSVKLLTNITQDHLDYHKTLDRYRETKLSFMEKEEGLSLYPETYKTEDIGFPTALLGKFNHENLQASVSILKALELENPKIAQGLSEAKAPPGRFEPIDCGQPFLVIVDYAHTPDGLEKVLETARTLTSKQVRVVFGCGGDRDREKRPQMGKIAHALADEVILTSDNPRSENPISIVNDILTGIAPGAQTMISVILDRRKAILQVLSQAKAGDVVLVAGKGHETEQIIQGESLHFDDREEIQRVLMTGSL